MNLGKKNYLYRRLPVRKLLDMGKLPKALIFIEVFKLDAAAILLGTLKGIAGVIEMLGTAARKGCRYTISVYSFRAITFKNFLERYISEDHKNMIK